MKGNVSMHTAYMRAISFSIQKMKKQQQKRSVRIENEKQKHGTFLYHKHRFSNACDELTEEDGKQKLMNERKPGMYSMIFYPHLCFPVSFSGFVVVRFFRLFIRYFPFHFLWAIHLNY